MIYKFNYQKHNILPAVKKIAADVRDDSDMVEIINNLLS